MPSLIGNYNFAIDAYLTDFRGKATLPMISNFVLHVATKHAEERGFGYSAMASRNRAWVLSRLVIEMLDYPEKDEEILVKTWVADVNKVFTERYVSFEKSDGKLIGFARTVWAAIDVTTRKPTNVLELPGLINYKTESDLLIEGAKKIHSLKEVDPAGKFTVRYSDVDINGHLNSMKYIEHFVDMFNIEMFKTKDIRRIEVNYINEAHFDTSLRLYKKEEAENVYVLEMRKEDVVISCCRVYWS